MTTNEPDLPLRLLARVFVPFACGYFFSYFFRVVNAVISPDLVRDVGVDANRLGLLTSAYFLAFAAAQLPLGIALDRFGPRRVNASLLVVAAAGALVFGTSESLGRARRRPGADRPRRLRLPDGEPQGVLALVPDDPVRDPQRLAARDRRPRRADRPRPRSRRLLRLTDWRHIFDGLAAATFVAAMLIFFVVPGARGEPRRARASASSSAASGTIYGDPVFWRIGIISMTVQATFLATQGLWAAPWLRDVAGFDRTAVAGILFAMAIATTAGFASSGSPPTGSRGAASRRSRIYKCGAVASTRLTLVFALGVTAVAVPAWCLFAFVGADQHALVHDPHPPLRADARPGGPTRRSTCSRSSARSRRNGGSARS